MNTEPKGLKSGIVIGRFQCPYLHEGHRHLIDTAFAENDIVFIMVGHKVNDELDEKNPYTFFQRYVMIQKEYPEALIGTLEDVPGNDRIWSMNLDELFSTTSNPRLYGSRDSFISSYSGKIPYREVGEIPGVSATKIREELKKKQDER